MGRRVVYDIEANPIPSTRIWVVVAIDLDTNEEFIFRENDRDKAKVFFDGCSTVIGHNIIEYDNECMQRIWDIEIPIEKVVDTIVLSRLSKPDRKHSLKELSLMVGEEIKTSHDDFSKWSQEMEDYCVQDVRATISIYKYLLKELEGYSKTSIKLEHQSQYYLAKQRLTGFKIDLKLAMEMRAELSDQYEQAMQAFREDFKPRKEVTRTQFVKYTKDGSIPKVIQKAIDEDRAEILERDIYEAVPASLDPKEQAALEDYEEVEKQFGCRIQRYKYKEFNINSPKELVTRLEPYWKPVEYTKATAKMKSEGIKRGSPKISAKNLETVSDDAPESIKMLKETMVNKSRAKLLDTIIQACDENGRLHGSVISTGAITHRMAHRNPNTGNMPKDIRKIFIVDDDKVLLGCDASGIQLRALAHYTKNEELVRQILHGDIHTYMQNIYLAPTRDIAKTITYSIIMGGSASLIGRHLNSTSKDGQAVLSRMMEQLHGWSAFKRNIRVATKKGFFTALDGRLVDIKSEHHAMAQYLQSYEQAVMKYVMVMSNKEIAAKNLPARQVAIVHDELQVEVDDADTRKVVDAIYLEAESITDKKERKKFIKDEMSSRIKKDSTSAIVGEIIRNNMVKAGKLFNSRCPLDGEWQVGRNWSETH